MPSMTITRTIAVGGVTLSGSTTRTEEGLIQQQVSLAAGKAGAISATGIDGLATGHGITDSDTVDVHWTDDDGIHRCRYGIAVDTAATNAITFDDDPAAAGDTLPDEDTDVVVCVQTTIDVDVNAANVKALVVLCDQDAHIDLQNDDPASMYGLAVNRNTPWIWNEGEGLDNPFLSADDDVLASILASNGSTSSATLKFSLLYDSVS